MKIKMDWLFRCFGTLAVIVTISGNIPQIIKIYKTKKTKDISTSGLVLKMIGKIMMLIYAFYFHLWELFAPNIISFLLTTIILIQKYYYIKTQNNFIPLDYQHMIS
jgi:MtN3 and saliva related transmembrane protein